MGVIIRVDEWILGKLTQFCHWWQKQTGLTNFFFCKLGVFVSLLEIVVRVGNYFWPFLGHPTYLFSLFVVTFLGFKLSQYLPMLDKLINHEFSQNAPTMSPLRIPVFSFFRILYMPSCFSLGLYLFIKQIQVSTKWWPLEAIFYLGLNLGIWIILFFMAIIPLPPSKSKLREWVEKLLPSPEPELAKAPSKV